MATAIGSSTSGRSNRPLCQIVQEKITCYPWNLETNEVASLSKSSRGLN